MAELEVEGACADGGRVFADDRDAAPRALPPLRPNRLEPWLPRCEMSLTETDEPSGLNRGNRKANPSPLRSLRPVRRRHCPPTAGTAAGAVQIESRSGQVGGGEFFDVDSPANGISAVAAGTALATGRHVLPTASCPRD